MQNVAQFLLSQAQLSAQETQLRAGHTDAVAHNRASNFPMQAREIRNAIDGFTGKIDVQFNAFDPNVV